MTEDKDRWGAVFFHKGRPYQLKSNVRLQRISDNILSYWLDLWTGDFDRKYKFCSARLDGENGTLVAVFNFGFEMALEQGVFRPLGMVAVDGDFWESLASLRYDPRSALDFNPKIGEDGFLQIFRNRD